MSDFYFTFPRFHYTATFSTIQDYILPDIDVHIPDLNTVPICGFIQRIINLIFIIQTVGGISDS